MIHPARAAVLLAAVCLLPAARADTPFRWRPLLTTAERIYAISAPAGDPDHLYFCEGRAGRVRLFDLASNTLRPTAFVTITPLDTAGETGLLGMAFHPKYAENGYLFLCYTRPQPRANVVVRYTRSAADPFTADPASRREILTYPAAGIHNGGWLGFGADGMLYVACGENGNSASAQALDTLRGKLLRIQVDTVDAPYAIPASNPFANTAGARGEIWALGLRNPFRCSFDRATGAFYIADVGASSAGEINFEAAGAAGGTNWGWPYAEGFICRSTPANCALGHAPIQDYVAGVATIGGYVYRGQRIWDLRGTYFAGDLSADLKTFRYDGTTVTDLRTRTGEETPGRNLYTFGEDARGELYCYADGALRRLEPRTATVGDMNGDGVLNFDDIPSFVLALVDAAGYREQFPALNPAVLADCDLNGVANFDDIEPFLTVLLQESLTP